MSLHLEFEPHAWYMGFAIKDDRATHNDPENYYLWNAYTDNGNTYRVDEVGADTLREVREKIRAYHLRQRNGYGERIAARRLEYLRGELEAERISYGELSELQDLTPYIDAGDVQLLEAAGVPEHA